MQCVIYTSSWLMRTDSVPEVLDPVRACACQAGWVGWGGQRRQKEGRDGGGGGRERERVKREGIILGL